MSTRAASAANSRRAKQEIVRLLFGANYSQRGPEAHRKLDPFRYSYSELRTAYLERLHDIHPDKSAHKSVTTSEQNDVRPGKGELHRQFVELQEAWDRYETVMRMMKNVQGGEKEEPSFTMFGVGCSFSDTPEEQKRRAEITDQACRGWFSSGEIAEVSVAAKSEMEKCGTKSSLIDDDWFISAEEINSSSTTEHNNIGDSGSVQPKTSRRSLVDPYFQRRK